MSKLIKVLFVFGIFCFAVNNQSFAQVEDDFDGRVMVEMGNDQLPQNATITNEVKLERNQPSFRSAPNNVVIKSNNNTRVSLIAYLRFMFRFSFNNPFALG